MAMAEKEKKALTPPPPSGELAVLTPMAPNGVSDPSSTPTVPSTRLTAFAAVMPSTATPPRGAHLESVNTAGANQTDAPPKTAASQQQQPKARRKPVARPKKDADDAKSRSSNSMQSNFAPSYMLAPAQAQMIFVHPQSGQQYLVLPPYNNQSMPALRSMAAQQQLQSQGLAIPGNSTAIGASGQSRPGALSTNQNAVSSPSQGTNPIQNVTQPVQHMFQPGSQRQHMRTNGALSQSPISGSHGDRNGNTEQHANAVVPPDPTSSETGGIADASGGQNPQSGLTVNGKPIGENNSPQRASSKNAHMSKQPSPNKNRPAVRLPAPRPIAPTNLLHLPVMVMSAINGQNIPMMAHPQLIANPGHQPFVNVFQQQQNIPRLAFTQPSLAPRGDHNQGAKLDENGDLGLENEPPPLLAQSDTKEECAIQQMFSREAVKFREAMGISKVLKHRVEEFDIEESDEPFPIEQVPLDGAVLQRLMGSGPVGCSNYENAVGGGRNIARSDCTQPVGSAKKEEAEKGGNSKEPAPTHLESAMDETLIQGGSAETAVTLDKGGETMEISYESDETDGEKSAENKSRKAAARKSRQKAAATASKSELTSAMKDEEKKEAAEKRMRKRKTNELDRLLQMDFGPSQGRLCDIMSGSPQSAKKTPEKAKDAEVKGREPDKEVGTGDKLDNDSRQKTDKTSEAKRDESAFVKGVQNAPSFNLPHEDVMEKFIVEDRSSPLQSADVNGTGGSAVKNSSQSSRSSGGSVNNTTFASGQHFVTEDDIGTDRCYYCNALLCLKRLPNYPQYCSKKCRKLWKKKARLGEEQPLAVVERSSLYSSSLTNQTSPKEGINGSKEHSRSANIVESSAVEKNGVTPAKDSNQAQERSPTTLTLKKISSEKAEIINKSPPTPNETAGGSKTSVSAPKDEKSPSKRTAKDEAALWTCDEVAKWITRVTGSEDVAAIFRKEEIDGQSLLLIAEDPHRNLGELLGLKLGPLVKVIKALHLLSGDTGTSP